MASRDGIAIIIEKYGKYLPAEKVQQLKQALTSAKPAQYMEWANSIGNSDLDSELITGRNNGPGMQRMRKAVDNILSQRKPKSPPKPAPAPAPKVTPAEFVETKKAAVKEAIQGPKPAPVQGPQPMQGPKAPSTQGPTPPATPSPSSSNARLKLAQGPVPPKPTATPQAQSFLKGKLGQIPLVGGLLTGVEAILDTQEGENPLYATGRAITGALSGTVGAIGTSFVGAEPQDPISSFVVSNAGYNEGYKAGVEQFDNLFGKYSTKGDQPASQQAIPPVPVDPRGPGRLDDPIAGKGPKGNEVGSDAQPEVPGLQGSAAPAPAPTPAPTGPTPETTRTSPTGIEQKGKDLSSINSGLSAVGVGPLQDMGRFFDGGAFKVDAPATKETKEQAEEFSVDDAVAMGMPKSQAESIKRGEITETVITPTAAGTVGGNPENPQDGTSAKPTVAERVRQIRGARQQEFASRPGNRAFEQPDETPAASGPNAMRRAARSAVLDAPAGQGVMGVIGARDAAVGISDDGVLVDGELRRWGEGVDQKTKRRAAYVATGGFGTREKLDEWTGQFLQPGSEKTPEKAEPQVPSDLIQMPSKAVMDQGEQEFFEFFKNNRVKKQ